MYIIHRSAVLSQVSLRTRIESLITRHALFTFDSVTAKERVCEG